MVDPKILRKYQLYRVDCDYREDFLNKGAWCNKKNIKCCIDNCDEYNTPPFISTGNKKSKSGGYHNSKVNDVKGLSERDSKAFEMRNKGVSFSSIAKKIKVSKSRAWQIVNEANRFINKIGVNDKGMGERYDKGKVNDKHLVRLHNDVFSFSIDPIDLSMCKDVVKLKYTSYLLDKRFKDKHIQIWSKKVIVRFKEDIKSSSLVECKVRAKQRVRDFLSNYIYQGINFGDEVEQVSRHYAILNTGVAKKFVKEKRKLFVFDKDDNKCRIEIDFSRDKPEFELAHPIKSDSDVDVAKEYFDSLLNDNHYTPGEVRGILDTILSTQVRYADQIEKHLKVQDITISVMKQMQRTLRKMELKMGGKNGR